MTSEPTSELDLKRLPYETKRAVEAGGILIEQITLGLNVIPHEDHLEVTDCHGTTVAAIPLYRLARIDHDLIPEYLAAAADQFPDNLRDQIIAGIRDDATVIRDFTNGEHVAIDVGPIKVALIHRCRLVPSWPRPAEGEVEP